MTDYRISNFRVVRQSAEPMVRVLVYGSGGSMLARDFPLDLTTSTDIAGMRTIDACYDSIMRAKIMDALANTDNYLTYMARINAPISCTHCNELWDCTCVLCDYCDSLIEPNTGCDECLMCEDCAQEHWECGRCHDHFQDQSRTEQCPQCEYCEYCETCCECAHCENCGAREVPARGRSRGNPLCSTCGECQDGCCTCWYCEACQEAHTEDIAGCGACNSCTDSLRLSR